MGLIRQFLYAGDVLLELATAHKVCRFGLCAAEQLFRLIVEVRGIGVIAFPERNYHPGLRRFGENHNLRGCLTAAAQHDAVLLIEADGARRGHAGFGYGASADGPGMRSTLPSDTKQRAESGGGGEVRLQALLGLTERCENIFIG